MAQEGGAEAAVVAEQEDGSIKAVVVFASLKPQLVVPEQKTEAVVQFYKAAFGAEEVRIANYPKRKAEQDAPLHLFVEINIGSSSLLICDDKAGAATKPGGGVLVFLLETEEVEAPVLKAVKVGASLDGELLEGEGPCGGGLSGKLRDPFAQVWIISSFGKSCVSEAKKQIYNH